MTIVLSREQKMAYIRSLLTSKSTVDASVDRLNKMKESIVGSGGTNSSTSLLKKLEQKPSLLQDAGLGFFNK